MSDVIIRLKNIDKSFGSLKILRNLSLDIHKNQMTVIYGPSGCGKSTLLNLIGLLDTADKGDLYMFDKQVPKPFSKQAQKLLSESIGYLFQNFALIEHKSVEYNLALAIPKSKAEFRASTISKALEDVGLKGFENKKVFQCSGGEQQRIAIARLLIKPCELVLCDEPTGSLDDDNKKAVMELLEKLKQKGKTLIIVSHDKDMIARANRSINLLEINQVLITKKN